MYISWSIDFALCHCHRLKFFLYSMKWRQQWVFVPHRALVLVILINTQGELQFKSTKMTFLRQKIGLKMLYYVGLKVYGCTIALYLKKKTKKTKQTELLLITFCADVTLFLHTMIGGLSVTAAFYLSHFLEFYCFKCYLGSFSRCKTVFSPNIIPS